MLIRGSRESDELFAGAGGDWIRAGSGNDEVYGGEGNDTLGGQTGDDELRGGWGWDTLWGGRGNDTLLDNDGVLYGGKGNDTFGGYGAAGGNSLYMFGDAGNDLLLGNNAIMIGGAGNDGLCVEGIYGSWTAAVGGTGADDFVLGAVIDDGLGSGVHIDKLRFATGYSGVAGTIDPWSQLDANADGALNAADGGGVFDREDGLLLTDAGGDYVFLQGQHQLAASDWIFT
jgi:Ca2+-binding RTX toxin-like protein